MKINIQKNPVNTSEISAKHLKKGIKQKCKLVTV